MALFHHILYPVDFSQRCKSVAAAVLAMARQHKATLTLLHTFELPVGGYGDAYAYLPTAINEFNDASQTALDRFALEHFPGELIQKTVQCGAPVESIVEFVDRNGVDLVMMASHGRSRFRSLLLGSVTAGVLHDAHCPVWTDSHSEEIPPVLDGYRNIVCAIDLTPISASFTPNPPLKTTSAPRAHPASAASSSFVPKKSTNRWPSKPTCKCRSRSFPGRSASQSPP